MIGGGGQGWLGIFSRSRVSISTPEAFISRPSPINSERSKRYFLRYGIFGAAPVPESSRFMAQLGPRNCFLPTAESVVSPAINRIKIFQFWQSRETDKLIIASQNSSSPFKKKKKKLPYFETLFKLPNKNAIITHIRSFTYSPIHILFPQKPRRLIDPRVDQFFRRLAWKLERRRNIGRSRGRGKKEGKEKREEEEEERTGRIDSGRHAT